MTASLAVLLGLMSTVKVPLVVLLLGYQSESESKVTFERMKKEPVGETVYCKLQNQIEHD